MPGAKKLARQQRFQPKTSSDVSSSGVNDMSLLGSVGSFLKKGVKSLAGIVDNPLTRAAGVVMPGVGQIAGIAGVVAGNKAVTRSLVGPSLGAGSALTSAVSDPRVASNSGFTWSSSGPMSSLGFTATSSSSRRRTPRMRADGTVYYPRRMNPLNARAARRAIRRIKAVRKITRDIERSLPKVQTRSRRAA